MNYSIPISTCHYNSIVKRTYGVTEQVESPLQTDPSLDAILNKGEWAWS